MVGHGLQKCVMNTVKLKPRWMHPPYTNASHTRAVAPRRKEKSSGGKKIQTTPYKTRHNLPLKDVIDGKNGG